MSTGVNPKFTVHLKKNKSIEYYLDGLEHQNRFILSECITLLESTVATKRALGEQILERLNCSVKTNTIRVGITGSPGVGKSTFIEAFGLHLISKKHKPAILAIDPSSRKNKGSILGDKTRMQLLSSHDLAYVRPTPSGAVLGGTATYTKEAITLCEAAGYDIIIVETVGVGQSETEVDNITDVNLLLLQPGAGDDIQGIKRGVVENADIFVINKADGSQLNLAKSTKLAYTNAIRLFHHDIPEWDCPVILVSSTDKTGLEEVYDAIQSYTSILTEKLLLKDRRMNQELQWFEKQVIEKAYKIILSNPQIKTKYQSLLDDLTHERIHASTAIQEMEKLLQSLSQSQKLS